MVPLWFSPPFFFLHFLGHRFSPPSCWSRLFFFPPIKVGTCYSQSSFSFSSTRSVMVVTLPRIRHSFLTRFFSFLAHRTKCRAQNQFVKRPFFHPPFFATSPISCPPTITAQPPLRGPFGSLSLFRYPVKDVLKEPAFLVFPFPSPILPSCRFPFQTFLNSFSSLSGFFCSPYFFSLTSFWFLRAHFTLIVSGKLAYVFGALDRPPSNTGLDEPLPSSLFSDGLESLHFSVYCLCRHALLCL